MDRILRAGSQGPSVRELQQLLNSQVRPRPNLTIDGRFDSRTGAAVRRFQRDKWLVADGDVGRCTWAALRGRERYVTLHRVRLVPQWTTSTCWSAATAMLLGVRM